MKQNLIKYVFYYILSKHFEKFKWKALYKMLLNFKN